MPAAHHTCGGRGFWVGGLVVAWKMGKIRHVCHTEIACSPELIAMSHLSDTNCVATIGGRSAAGLCRVSADKTSESKDSWNLKLLPNHFEAAPSLIGEWTRDF